MSSYFDTGAAGTGRMAEVDTTRLSPMMQQYFDIKCRYGKYILFYRLGDFYEMFFDDAQLASKELDLVLTGRDCGLEQRAPMCGVPYHSCEGYISRLIARGYKVAVCEQVENPKEAKGIVKRDVVRIVTPGTLTEPEMLSEGKNNYLASVFGRGGRFGLAFTDISTGAVYATVTDGGVSGVICELARFSPSELIINESMPENLRSAIQNGSGISYEYGDEHAYGDRGVGENLKAFFGYLAGAAGFAEAEAALSAAAAYIGEVYRDGIKFCGEIEWYGSDRYMSIDGTARKNLELERTIRTGDRRGSLLEQIDATCTPMGKRTLAQYLQRPLLDCAMIMRRQNAAAELLENDILRAGLSEALSGVLDMERIITRIAYGSANAREVRALSFALERLPDIKAILSGCRSALLCEVRDCLDTLEDVRGCIEAAVADEPPLAITEGGIIRDGYDGEVDRLRGLLNNSHDALAAVEAEEKEKTGIRQLKIGYNRVFGYYIEVSKGNMAAVPDYFIRKQTLSTGERYITPRLKELENDILQGKSRLTALEYDLFCQLRGQVAAAEQRVRGSAAAIAVLDVMCSFAAVAARNNYCRPVVDDSDKILIAGGRHPVVENALATGFVPNDTVMDNGENKILIITGPNMAGKSTYMRQNALIVIMAQIGCFVPAKSAHIGVVDAVFTRVGASDDLSAGQSTFMVEMSELAFILKNATVRSLIILDEIGRGTSTFDGMSIAGAVIEYLAGSKAVGGKTLFATHYHELCDFEDRVAGVKNYNILVKKRGDEITFLRKIARGGADDSYGIEVGKLAGVPEAVISKAKAHLRRLEADRRDKVYADKPLHGAFAEGEQAAFLDDVREKIMQKLKNTDVNGITPMDALALLSGLCDEARDA